MNRDVLLDKIQKNAREMAKYVKSYQKYLDRPVGPNDLYKAEQYMQLEVIQKGLLRKLNEC